MAAIAHLTMGQCNNCFTLCMTDAVCQTTQTLYVSHAIQFCIFFVFVVKSIWLLYCRHTFLLISYVVILCVIMFLYSEGIQLADIVEHAASDDEDDEASSYGNVLQRQQQQVKLTNKRTC